MATRHHEKDVVISKAEEADLDSLTTIHIRSFHPVNPVLKKMLPDTPRIREWWTKTFESEINDPSCHLLVARMPGVDAPEPIVGVLALRLMDAEDSTAGLWDLFPTPPETPYHEFREMADGMPKYRAKLMAETPSSYLIELLGVDHAWKGNHFGVRLLTRACEIADETGHDIFVQANGGAKAFYEKLGFKCEMEVPIGDGSYVECMLVKRYKK